jgi:enediyne biosynthesis protein E5
MAIPHENSMTTSIRQEKPIMNQKQKDPRLGLKNSSFLATLLAVIGHVILGFEQSLAQWGVALVAGYGSAFLFEYIDASVQGQRPRYEGGGFKGKVLFLLAPHMTATTMAFLLYTNDRLDAMAFAVVAAIGSKHIFRTWDGKRFRHFMNPSNFGLALCFFVLPWTNTIPYHFTERFGDFWDWVVLAVLVALGTRLNLMFTGRLLLIGSWLTAFAGQAIVRSVLGTSVLPAELMMMTGPGFALFTFYMITDPQTSPSSRRSQIAYGAGIAAVYGLLMVLHVVFAIFFAVTIVCAIRGAYLVIANVLEQRSRETMTVVGAARGGSVLAGSPVLVPASAVVRMEVRHE